MWIAKAHRPQIEEHSQGEDYRLVSPAPRRHVRHGCGRAGRWCAADPDRRGHGSGAQPRAGRGLSGRPRCPTRRAGRLRSGGVRPDRVTGDRGPGRRRARCFAGDRHRPGRGARHQAWRLAGEHAPDHGRDAKQPLVIDLDATLVTSHSEKEHAAPTFKRGFGFHPLTAFLDHGPDGTGEPLAILLRPGNAGSNTATDHIGVIRQALAQLPAHRPGHRPGRKVLIRTDGAGGTKKLIEWLTGQRLSYSVGFTLPANTPDLLAKIPENGWTPAYDAHDQVRDGAWVAELTGLMDLEGWPAGMRVIVRKERPHPGAQLRFDDVDGMRITAFVTNTTRGQLPDLELRHRRRARCEDRIRLAKDTGLRNLPLHGFAANQIWCAIVTLASDLLAWMGMLALTGHDARRWEPKRLRHRLFSIPSDRAPWAAVAVDAIHR